MFSADWGTLDCRRLSVCVCVSRAVPGAVPTSLMPKRTIPHQRSALCAARSRTALSGGCRSHTAMRQQASVVGYWFQVCSKPHEVIWVESISVVPSMVRSRSRVAGCQHQQMFGWGWVWGQCSKNPRVKLLSSCIFIVTVWVDLQVGSVWDFYC